MSEVILINYDEVLESLDPEKSHLLLGNGFNNSLGVKTDYKSIFKRMMDDFKGYKNLESEMKAVNYDIEKVIGKLKEQIIDGESKVFLDKFINTKFKLDFMKSAHEIVRDQIKNIYQEKNKGVYLLLKCFKNYFTLNYDSLLYLLLMKFKKAESDELAGGAIAIQNTLEFQQDEMNKKSEIYKIINQAYQDGELKITVEGKEETRKLNNLSKTKFLSELKEYFKKSNYSGKTIERAVNLLWKSKEDENKQLLRVNDGFWPKINEFSYGSQRIQNLFFLHGAFHIYEKNGGILKIIQESEKALYEKLEEILESENEDVICVFADDNKEAEITENEYLSAASDKLLTLEGSIVIIGSSLSNNDKHIFEKINQSKIDTVYYASKESNKTEDYSKAFEFFKDKEIILFDRETISYEI